jgi:hypothetical protein
MYEYEYGWKYAARRVGAWLWTLIAIAMGLIFLAGLDQLIHAIR